MEAFQILKRKKHLIGFQLVIIGHNYDNINFNNFKDVLYLGKLKRLEVLSFLNCSQLVLQPSKLEGIPRVSLESLYLNKKILLPNCCPEYLIYKENIVEEINPISISEKILSLLNSKNSVNYDLKLHYPEISFKKYFNLLKKNEVL